MSWKHVGRAVGRERKLSDMQQEGCAWWQLQSGQVALSSRSLSGRPTEKAALPCPCPLPPLGLRGVLPLCHVSLDRNFQGRKVIIAGRRGGNFCLSFPMHYLEYTVCPRKKLGLTAKWREKPETVSLP